MGLVWTSQIFPRTPRVTPLPLTFSHSVTHTHGLEMMRVNTLDERLMETDNKSLLVLLGCFWCCVARTAGCSGHPSSEDTWRSWSLPVSSAALPGPESAAETTDWEGKQEHHFVAPQGNLRAEVVGLKSGWGGSHRSFLEPNLHLQRLSIPAVNVITGHTNTFGRRSDMKSCAANHKGSVLPFLLSAAYTLTGGVQTWRSVIHLKQCNRRQTNQLDLRNYCVFKESYEVRNLIIKNIYIYRGVSIVK